MTDEQDPITNIEQKAANYDTGRIAYLMLSGAIEEGATLGLAFLSVAAYYCGMFSAMGLGKEEDEDDG